MDTKQIKRKQKNQLSAFFMLTVLTVPFMLHSTALVARAEGTEAGITDYCYVGSDQDSGTDSSSGGDKVETIPIKLADENLTGKAAMKEIADAVGKKLNISPALVYAQMCQETGPNGDSQEAVQDKNYGGIKGTGGGSADVEKGAGYAGGTYQKFNSLSDFASRFAAVLKNDGLEGAKTPEEYVHRLKMRRYFEAPESQYLAGVKALMAGYYGDTSSDASAASGDDSDASGSGTWHKGDDSFAPDSLNTTWTTGYGTGDSQSEQTSPSATGAGGDWTQPNSESYKTAKAIFDYFTKTLGFSGAGAAAVVGNAYAESGFNPKADNGSHTGLFQWDTGGRLRGGNIIRSSADLTVENELNLAKWELNNKFQSVKNSVGHATDAQSAAIDWLDHYEIAPGQAEAKRKAAAVQAYQLFDGASISANDSLLGSDSAAADAGATQSQDNANGGKQCGNTSDDTDNGDILEIAKKLLGYFTYGGARPVNTATMNNPNSKNISDVNKNGVTDCSGYVWLVLYLAGYKVPSGGWFTGSMWDDAKGKHQYLKEIDESEAKAGDIIIVGGSNSAGAAGHTGILEEKWHGESTKIINEGGAGGSGGVNETTFSGSFESSLAGKPKMFARPVSKDSGN